MTSRIPARRGRDKIYIIAEVLDIARNGCFKTQIMYKANLSFSRLNDYLGYLLGVGLLEESKEEGKDVYRITSKGVRFLQNYYRITDILGKPTHLHKRDLQRKDADHEIAQQNSGGLIAKVEDLNRRLKLMDTRLSDFLTKNHAFQYCPYCGKEINKPKEEG